MSTKMFYLLLHFIGVGLIIAGALVSTFILMLGLTWVIVHAVCLALYCNVELK